MAQYDGSIRINTQLNTKGFEKGAKGLIAGMEKLGGSLRGIISSLGFGLGIAGLIALGKQAIKTASDIQEVQNVVDTAFGRMSYKMEKFADTAVKQFGISRLSAKEMGSTFMAMGRSMTGNLEKASDMAIALTGRAADMASFYNKSVEETSTALKSIYTGETEVLKAYGVVMTEVNLQEYAATKGITKKISAMTQAEKVQLRYNYVMEQTSLAAGDFAKTSDSWANQTRILSEQFKELLSIIGSGLITVLTPVVKFLNTILTQLIAIAKQIGAILSKLFGISIPTADSSKFAADLSSAAEGADELAEGVEAAGKAANKALAPFDKLNVLGQESGSGESGAGGSFEMPELEMEESQVEEVDAFGDALDRLLEKLKPLFDWFKKLKELFIEGFFDGLGDSWKERVDEIIADSKNIVKNLIEIFTDPGVVAAAKTMIEKIVYALGQIAGAVVSIGITIAQNVIGGIDKYLEQNKEFLKQKLISIFDITGDIALLIGEACATIAYIFEAFGSENGQELTANIIGIFANAFMWVTELAAELFHDIANIIIKPFVDNKDALRTALEGFLGVLADVAGTIKQGIDDTFSKLKEVYDNHFKPFFDSIANGLSDTVGKFMEFWNGSVQPMLDEWAAEFDFLWKEHIQPMIDKFVELFGKVADSLSAFWNETLKPFIDWIIDNILPKLLPVFDGIYDALIDVAGKAADIIGSVIDKLGEFVDWLTNHQSVVQDFIIIIGSFFAAWEIVNLATTIHGIITALASFVTALVTFITTGGLAATAAGVLGAAISFLTSPITIAVAIIGSLIAIGVLLYKNWDEISEKAKEVWEFVKEKFEEFSAWLKNVFETDWTDAFGVFGEVLNGFLDIVGSIWDSIKQVFGGIIDFIAGVFTGDWERAWNGVVEIFKGIFNLIPAIVEGVINGAIWIINGIIGGINALTDVVGIPAIPDIPKVSIPRLADGAVIRGGDPFMAVLGDQRRGQTNIETPLPTMIKAFKQAMAESGGMGGGEYTFVAQLDGRVIFEETVRQDRMYSKATGHSKFEY